MLLLSGFIPLTAFNINAQVYQKSSRATKFDNWNKDQLDQALAHSLEAAKTGKTLTFVGIGTGIIGGIVGWDAVIHQDGLSGNQKGLETKGMGLYVMEAGLLTATIGIPIWIGGAKGKKRIEIALAKSGTARYVDTAGLKITF